MVKSTVVENYQTSSDQSNLTIQKCHYINTLNSVSILVSICFVNEQKYCFGFHNSKDLLDL